MYQVFYHKAVLNDDFKKLSIVERKKIIKDIDKKLTTEPAVFGKPLSAKLKGYYRLRIGNFRVVYTINKGKVFVFILKVGMRRDSEVYIQAAKRLKLL